MTDINQTIADIDQRRADDERRRQAARLPPWQIAAVLVAGAAACFVAGAMVARWALGW